MPNPWPIVPLGGVIRQRPEFVRIDDLQAYKRVRVQLHAKGIVLRDTVSGTEIKTKQQQVCQAGELLVAEIDAKVGGFGIVPDDLAGAIVSSHYFLFEVNGSTIDARFLDFFIRTPFFQDQVRAQGSTNYAAIRPIDVLNYKIPLPPLEEQRRIVARIEQLAAKIQEVRHTQVDVIERCDALCRSMIFSKSGGVPVPTAMGTFVKLREPDIDVQRGGWYSFAGVYCFGKGVFPGATKSGMEFEYSRLTRLRTGNFVYPKLMAWEGALGVVPSHCDGLVVSPEFPVFEIDQSQVLPETLDVYFRTPSVWPLVAEISTGTNVRRRRLHPSAFLRYEMPLPRMDCQLKLREVKRRVDALKRLQAETAAELDALLPSILDRAFRGQL